MQKGPFSVGIFYFPYKAQSSVSKNLLQHNYVLVSRSLLYNQTRCTSVAPLWTWEQESKIFRNRKAASWSLSTVQACCGLPGTRCLPAELQDIRRRLQASDRSYWLPSSWYRRWRILSRFHAIKAKDAAPRMTPAWRMNKAQSSFAVFFWSWWFHLLPRLLFLAGWTLSGPRHSQRCPQRRTLDEASDQGVHNLVTESPPSEFLGRKEGMWI